MLKTYEYLATRRKDSFLAPDMDRFHKEIESELSGARVAVIGAAGSIGIPVVKQLLRYPIKNLHLFDLSENNLVEVVRDLRSSSGVSLPQDFRANPIGLGSWEFQAYFDEYGPFDYIFNLSALKHVRSEKDTYSLARMIQTNVIFLFDFLESLKGQERKLFSVSSDKAVNPGNVMGASKMVMEQVLWAKGDKIPVSSARFANVAFSDGSLLYGFLKRFEKRQPLAAPNDIKRFFMSHQEAGELCVLSGVLGKNREIFLPKDTLHLTETTFSDIAMAFLEQKGFSPFLCETETQAKQNTEKLIAQKKWPCFFSSSNTMGEKPFEEFVGIEEEIISDRFHGIDVAEASRCSSKDLQDFISWAKAQAKQPHRSKSDYLAMLSKIVPGFEHVASEQGLDSKM